jgi:hypothetical protein
MELYDKIKTIYSQLTTDDFHHINGTIHLQNDGNGDYIAKWEHPTLTRPTEAQLEAAE